MGRRSPALKSGRRPNISDSASVKSLKPSGLGIRTVVVVPALEEIKALLSKAGWQCEVRADKDQGVHFTIYRANVKGERPYMTFQPEKSKDAIVIYVATRGSGSQLGNFTVDQITQDFVQTEALKFFERLTSELSTPSAHDRAISRTDDPRYHFWARWHLG